MLVVDDDATMRQVARTTLIKAGYQVLIASDGSEALALFHARRHEISVVLTDMMMPVMDGPALVSALRKLGSQVPIITMSGLVEAGSSPLHSALVSAFLEKPVTAETLLNAVRTALHGNQPSLPL